MFNNTKYSDALIVVVLAANLLILTPACLADDVQQDPVRRTARLQKSKLNDTCGELDDLAEKVEICSQPLMDIIEGTMKKWPTSEKEAQEMCDSFAGSERCIRDVGRRCAKGLPKTLVSTLANSVQRVRKRECSKAKYPIVLKTTQCIQKHQVLIGDLISNATRGFLFVERKITNLDQKTNSVCCMVHMLEGDIKALLDPRCSEESAQTVKLYRAIMQDVLDLICRAPKCNEGTIRSYTIPKTEKNEDGIISILLRIIFSLSD